MQRTTLVVLAAMLVTVPSASASLLAADDVQAPAAGPGTGLRYTEHVNVANLEQQSTRIVTVDEPEAILDGRGLETEAVPVTVQRRVDGEVRQAERCWAAPDTPEALRREPITRSGTASLLERAWRLTGGPPGAFDPRPTSWPGEATDASFEGEPCPARGLGTTVDPEQPDSIPLERLLPAGLPTPEDADVEGEVTVEDAGFHGREARWTNATFSLRLPGPLPSAERTHRGPLFVEGQAATLWADGLPGPARRVVELTLHAPHAPTYDRQLAWQLELTGHRDGQQTELTPAPPASGPDGSNPWTEDGPGTHGYDVAFPLEQAVETLEQRGARYQAYQLQHPEAIVTAATYASRDSPAPLDATPGPLTVEGPSWSVEFTDDPGEAYRGTVVETSEDGTGLEGVDDPNASSKTQVWESPTDGSRSQTARGADLDGVPPLASSDTVHERLDRLGFPDEEVHELGFAIQPTHAGAGLQTTIELAAAYQAPPAGASENTVRALVDGATGRVIALSQTTPADDASLQLPGPVPPTFDDEDPDGEAGAATNLPDGPAAGAGLAAGAGILWLLLVGLKSLLSSFFTRISRDELLENSTRRELLEAIREDPGVHLAELIEGAGVGNGATRHHLKKLEEADLVRAIKHGGYVRYFPAGEYTETEARQRAALRSGSNREVYEAYRQQPGQSIRQLARRLDMSSSGVHRAIRMLREVDLIDE